MVGRGTFRFCGLMFTLERCGDCVVIKKYDRAHGRWEVVKRVPDWDVAEEVVREWWLWLA